MIAIAASSTSTTDTLDHDSWWSSLKHGGLLISPSKLNQSFPATTDPLPRYLEDQLRREVTRFRNENTNLVSLLDTVLENILGLDRQHWEKASQVQPHWSYESLTGERIKPRRLWLNPNGATLPIFTCEDNKIGIGRGKRSLSRVIEWLRKAQEKIALLTNGRQWRLIHAGTDYDAWCEWDIDFWFEQGNIGKQVTALRLLLGKEALTSPAANTDSPLIKAIQASREGQAELSDTLGERVRQAVELLIQESNLDTASLQDLQINNRHIYIAASRMIMRCVVILFAEARNLLPRDNPIYNSAYSLQGLREQLEHSGGGQATDRLRNQYSAFPRLLALFRLVYEGCAHEAMPIPCYGGGLFAPGNKEATDPILRALSRFENNSDSPSDAVVHQILKLLTRSKVKVRQGKQNTWVEAPVDFSDLSSEYIGILYEGLLDFELRQADEDDPIIFLDLGDQPALPLKRLEAMDEKALASLVEKLKDKAKPETSEDVEEDTEEEDTAPLSNDDVEIAPLSNDDVEIAPLPNDDVEIAPLSKGGWGDIPEDGDTVAQLRDRAKQWGIKAVKAGKLVSKPKSRKQEKIREYERQVEKVAEKLIARIILPEQWFLVRWGGTRKGSGTFYTRPQLAVPTVQRTLFPLAYDTDTETPKTPAEILDLKVCDPACGSASFPIAALRFLVEALWKSLFHHGWLVTQSDPPLRQVSTSSTPTQSNTFAPLNNDPPFAPLNNDPPFAPLNKGGWGDRNVSPINQNMITVGFSETERPSWFRECVKDFPLTVENAEEVVKARLKRYVVERCIYGVDINPLAVELARLSLWVETMDSSLPFSFLDHKIKCGNALIGCWFDRFQDYPVMAWERDGGDANHDKFVHHFREYVVTRGKKKGQQTMKGDKWTAAIKETKNNLVKSELKTILQTLDPSQPSLVYPNFDLPKLPEVIHDEALNIFEELHNLPVYDSEERERRYREKIENSEAIKRLKFAFDTWCAVWFWSGENIDLAPTPGKFFDPPTETREIIQDLANHYQFFHWELEFPDVFAGENGGFDGIVGNPPWENLQPNPAEFFSNIDPLFRTYGRLEALEWRYKKFSQEPTIEKEWIEYNAYFNAMSNWVKNVADPFGIGLVNNQEIGLKGIPKKLIQYWKDRINKQKNYTGTLHPFQLQKGRIFTYRLFLEQSLYLLKQSGWMGMIIPSGIYTDSWSTPLREYLLNNCQWEWLFGFENRDKIFAIDSRYKFCPVILCKGGETEAIKATFMQRSLTSWEKAEDYVLAYPRQQVEQFSPYSKAILEIRSERDLEILKKIYSNSVLLGDDSPSGWGIKYSLEFMMNTDSKLFPPRPKWENKGYHPDEYGHWLKGNWQPYSGSSSILQRPQGLILSADGTSGIKIDEVEDIALPLYEGRMISQFDFSEKGWVSGKGRSAVWRDIPWENKVIEPQFLMKSSKFEEFRSSSLLKVGLMDVASATNSRTMTSSLLGNYPCGNKVPTFSLVESKELLLYNLELSTVLNSFVYDYQLRCRLGGLTLNYFILEETALIQPRRINNQTLVKSASLLIPSEIFSKYWLNLSFFINTIKDKNIKSLWAITPYERLRLRCILDAVVAELYGLEIDDFRWILHNCDHPVQTMRDKQFYRTLDPKGFWRVDKEKDPELRHTVLSLIAFHDLKRLGLETFLNLNDGEGWMLPDTLTLADYGLGHSDRAKQPQPVASRLGERYLPWQLEGTPEQSWEECERHAENLRQLLGETPKTFNEESSNQSYQSEKQLKLFQENNDQLDLF